MITVNVGTVPFCVDGSKLHALIGERLSDAFDYEGISPAKAKVIRLGMKMMMRETLAMIDRAVIQGKVPADIPAPDWALADKDILTYGASYIFALALRDLEKQAFEAEYTEGPNGEIILTGLHAAPALPSSGLAGFLASADDAEASTPAGTVGATGYADTPPADADTPAGGPPRDSGEGGGYVDAGGHEGNGQDHGAPASDAGTVAVIP